MQKTSGLPAGAAAPGIIVRALGAAVLACALGHASAAIAGDTEARIAFDGTVRWVDFFAEPSADGAVVDLARNGDRVTVRPGQGDWMQVMGHDGTWRWVPEAQVHPLVPDRPLRAVQMSEFDLDGTPVLAAPDAEARVLRILPNGTLVAIVARRSYYRLAELPGGRLGWLVNLGLAELAPEPESAPPAVLPRR